MARNSGGTHSLQAGNPVVNGRVIEPAVHNDTLSDSMRERKHVWAYRKRTAVMEAPTR
ncbi:MAG: hypothetical protein M3Q75_15270 [Gemmatimonadota bacterium]|nr:hypothetical protein [Gemmatimonadota bacterium]